MPVIPHTNTRFFHGQLTDQFWLDGTMEVLRRCDAMLVANDVAKTGGMLAEIDDACERKQPRFYTLTGLRDWLQENP